MKKVLITGSSGYFGSKQIAYLAAKPEIEQIVGTDLQPPGEEDDKLTFYKRDVREPCNELFSKHKMDTVIHTVWILPPIHDKAKTEDVNINETKTVLDSIAKAGVGRLLYTSSTTAYGFPPYNDNPLTEDSPLRGKDDFICTQCKRLVEKVVQDFTKDNLYVTVIVVRPCSVAGPGFKNPMATLLAQEDRAAAFSEISSSVGTRGRSRGSNVPTSRQGKSRGIQHGR